MKINRREAEMMDLVLEAFDENGRLSQEELLLLFDEDEQQASLALNLLKDSLLIEVSEDNSFINRNNQALTLMQNGGLTRQYDEAAAEPLQQTQTLHEKNQRILELESQVRKLESRSEQLQFIKGLVWLLGILVFGLAIWIVELTMKHHK